MAKEALVRADTEDSKTHVGHRSRMRRKLFDLGREVFDDYELLEMALYGAIPYLDTNPIAHRLLGHFGSLDAIFSSTEEELCEVSGVGARTARFLLTLGRVGQSAFLPQTEPVRKYSSRLIRQYLLESFQGVKESRTHMILLDNRLSVIDAEPVMDGDIGRGLRSTRVIVATALLRGATGLILVHNHPYGPDYATEGDHNVTQWLKGECAKAGLVLFEHYIVCGRSIRPILYNLSDDGLLAADAPYRDLLARILGGASDD